MVPGGHPEELGRALQAARGALPFPAPVSSLGGKPSLGRSWPAAVPGRAGRGALGCDPGKFHFWVLLGWCREGPSGEGCRAELPCAGPRLRDCFYSRVSRDPRLPPFSTPTLPWFHSAVPGATAAAAPAGAADPRRGPERRGRQEEQAVKPQAAGCAEPSCFSEVQPPLPSHPLRSHLAARTLPPTPRRRVFLSQTSLVRNRGLHRL